MIYSTATVPINPEGEPPLTRAQIWKGLVLKARDARLFLSPGMCTRCEVIAEGDGYIVRDATIGGEDLKEIVTFEPERKVTFHQFTGPREGSIINEIFEDADCALQLRFYCLIGLRDLPHDGPEERAEEERMNRPGGGYKRALLSTLARTRELVRDGKL
jgi:hypothetical protein